MFCSDETYKWDRPGPNQGGAASFDGNVLDLGESPVGITLFAIQFWQDPGPTPTATADAVLSLIANEGDDEVEQIRLVDRTTVSVDGQVQGRLVVAFPRAFPVPMSPNGPGRCKVRLSTANIAAACDRWVAWLSVVRGESRAYG